MTTLNMLALAGLIIILVLAAYALSLWREVRRKTELEQQQQHDREQRLAEDIEFLAQSLVNGQVPPIEGAIRIKVLLDNYTGPRREMLDLAVFETVYDATAHIPTHQAWKDLPRTTRREHEETMLAIETGHKSRLEEAAAQLSQGLADKR
ncbi:MAG: DUF2489 domain-containing protein [Pseudomonas sp.]|nr:DUF2489 domain-containing protein [Pseudomonas sp.]